MQMIMPAFAAVIVLFGLVRRVPVFDAFLEGAREGFRTLYQIAPNILGLIFAVSLLRTEGSHWETRNEYTIYVYYKPFGARYERLVGVKRIN